MTSRIEAEEAASRLAGKPEAEDEAVSVAAAYLELLSDRGVQYLFGNAGTDFAPVVEAYGRAAQRGTRVPRPIIAAHENLAISMAHGYAALSRSIPAVMVHVSVGTANMICGAMNAARENVALLLTAGRTPITELGMAGSRDGYIHWAQEMYDQAGMIREFVKWDYELRNPGQLATVVDRALAIAGTEPRGPVYLSLPREVLAQPMPEKGTPSIQVRSAAAAAPDRAAIALAAKMLANAERPLVITANAGRDAEAFAELSKFATRFAVPVVQHKPRYLSLPSSHPMNLGYDPARLVGECDVILAIETDVPWIPLHGGPAEGCAVIQCGVDPLYSHIPIRGFPNQLAITGGAADCLAALTESLGNCPAELIERRRRRVQNHALRLSGEREELRNAVAENCPIHPAWLSHCVGQAKESAAVVVSEYSLLLDHCNFDQPDAYFGSSSASGLGWGAGAALGAKLAAPDRTVVAIMGDGAYMFSNPAAVHHAAHLHDLPVLFVIMNNSRWHAVHRSTTSMYPQGLTASQGAAAFVELGKLPAFEQICASAGGYGERVDDPSDLAAALERAMKAVREEGRQALLNVICRA